MKVVLIHDAALPVQAYGGTERVVWWLSKALSERGITVVLASAPGTDCPWAEVVHPDFRRPIEEQVEAGFYHYFNTPAVEPSRPHVVTIGGNGKPGETFFRNTVFVSRNHALRHGAQCFVHNGVDPSEYVFNTQKDGSLLFLAKASWHVKNVRGAIRIARKANRTLEILGGKRLFFNHWRGIHWNGMQGGEVKARFLSRASALLFPVLWNEPFGIAVVEALISGTPVIASPLGSLPELIHPDVGSLCEDEQDYVAAIADLGQIKSSRCREWALEHFTHHHMAEGYLKLYEKVLKGEPLNRSIPATREAVDALYSVPLGVPGMSAPQPA